MFDIIKKNQNINFRNQVEKPLHAFELASNEQVGWFIAYEKLDVRGGDSARHAGHAPSTETAEYCRAFTKLMARQQPERAHVRAHVLASGRAESAVFGMFMFIAEDTLHCLFDYFFKLKVIEWSWGISLLIIYFILYFFLKVFFLFINFVHLFYTDDVDFV